MNSASVLYGQKLSFICIADNFVRMDRHSPKSEMHSGKTASTVAESSKEVTFQLKSQLFGRKK
jgi:hypothetical protein